MSTRCNIHFCEGKRIDANIYRHSDGYPDGNSGVLADMNKFFDAVEKDTKDTRYGDAEYLAAKFVVWQSQENVYKRKSDATSLDFLSVGICTKDHGDIEYIYEIHCDSNERPNITWKEAR